MRKVLAANVKHFTTDTMDEHDTTHDEQEETRPGASAHLQALRGAAELNRRLHAFEARMLEQFEQLARELDGGQGTICAEAAEIERQLALCERELSQGGAPAHGDAEQRSDEEHDRELADLQKRYEMAVSDIRDLKRQLAEQEKSGGATSKRAAAAPAAPTGPLDWEAQKRQLLAALEDEATAEPEPDEARAEERLQIEQVIRVTDATMRNKQAEIDELRAQLESAAAMAQSTERAASTQSQLESNELVQQEVARLQALETTLQANLRQAEIELSVERGRLARLAAELEEKQRGLVEQHGDHSHPAHLDATGKPKKPQRKWLARLGLNEEAK